LEATLYSYVVIPEEVGEVENSPLLATGANLPVAIGVNLPKAAAYIAQFG